MPNTIKWIGPAVIAFREKYVAQNMANIWRIYLIATKYDFGWWCGYFWKEARELEATDPKWQALLNELYAEQISRLPERSSLTAPQEKTDLGYYKKYVLPIIQKTLDIPPADDNRKKRILTHLLNMGFVEMMPTSDFAAIGTDFFQFQIPLNSTERFLVAFRGEGRSFQKIYEHGGAINRITRARTRGSTSSDYSLHNVHRLWHPFSDPDVGGKMYFRKASGDNCLYTVTSVADNVPVAVGFPLIDDPAVYNLNQPRNLVKLRKTKLQGLIGTSGWTLGEIIAAAEYGVTFESLLTKPFRTWTPAEIDIASKSGVKIVQAQCEFQDGSTKPYYFLGTENYMYITKLRGGVVHTQKIAKGDCKERGVREIPLNDFIIGVRIQRVHLGPTRMHGIYGFIQECKYYDGEEWKDISTLGTAGKFYDFHFKDRMGAVNMQAAESFFSTIVVDQLKLRKNGNQYLLRDEPEALIGDNQDSESSIKIIDGKRLNTIHRILEWGVTRVQADVASAFSLSAPTVFPQFSSGLASSLSNERILLNGMKVIFDQPVGVYPVNLESKGEAQHNGTRN